MDELVLKRPWTTNDLMTVAIREVAAFTADGRPQVGLAPTIRNPAVGPDKRIPCGCGGSSDVLQTEKGKVFKSGMWATLESRGNAEQCMDELTLPD